MKTLQEIKDEYAISKGFDSWGEMPYVKIYDEIVNDLSFIVGNETIINISTKAKEMQYFIDESSEDVLGQLIPRKIRTCYAVARQDILSVNHIPSL